MEEFLHRSRPSAARITPEGGGILGLYLRDMSSVYFLDNGMPSLLYFLEYNTLGRSLMYSPKIDIPPSPHLKYMVEESSVVRKRNWRKSRVPSTRYSTVYTVYPGTV